MILILMGVSGSGKSTIGQALAQTLNWQFIEGDRLHPIGNIEKMSQGIPLRDEERWPWLHNIRQAIDQLQIGGESAVITCSALKQSYRDFLREGHSAAVQFIYLKGSPETLRLRLGQRQGHFMKANMLRSQLATLEEPHQAMIINIDETNSIEQTVAQICERLNQQHSN